MLPICPKTKRPHLLCVPFGSLLGSLWVFLWGPQKSERQAPANGRRARRRSGAGRRSAGAGKRSSAGRRSEGSGRKSGSRSGAVTRGPVFSRSPSSALWLGGFGTPLKQTTENRVITLILTSLLEDLVLFSASCCSLCCVFCFPPFGWF